MRLADVIFLSVADVDDLHAMIIARHGGTLGVRDRGLLESAIMAPQAGYYASLAELAAALCHGLAKNHAYLDGNKRIAITATAAFLGANGYPLGALDADEWERLVVGVATGAVSREQLANHLAEEMGDPVVLEQ